MAIPVWYFKDLIDVIVGCANNKFDVIIFVEGNRGLGKSTLAYKVAVACKGRGLHFNPDKDIAYAREEVIKLLARNKRSVIFADELINVAYNRDFYQQDQKVLLKALNMYRDSCNVFIGCIPRFVDLDSQIQRLCKIRITILKRGIALIQTQKRSIYSTDVWDSKNNQKIEEKWNKSKNKRLSPYGRLSTTRGLLRFGDLKEEQRERYEKIKTEKRGHVYAEYGGDERKTDSEILVDNIYEKLINAKITKPEFIMVCETAGKKPDIIRTKLNNLLAENNKPERVEELLRLAVTRRLEDKEKQRKKEAEKKKILIVNPKPKEDEKFNADDFTDDKKAGDEGDYIKLSHSSGNNPSFWSGI